MTDKKTRTYQEIKSELDEIMLSFTDNLDIEEAVKNYEKASALVAELEKILEKTKIKINKLK